MLEVDQANRVLTLLQVQQRLGLEQVGPMAAAVLAEAALQVTSKSHHRVYQGRCGSRCSTAKHDLVCSTVIRNCLLSNAGALPIGSQSSFSRGLPFDLFDTLHRKLAIMGMTGYLQCAHKDCIYNIFSHIFKEIGLRGFP